MKISVIIPVYRVEPYLRQCVDSVLGQTYRDLEVILVDDGSPDHCPQICDEYAARDARVRVIHKENGGLSSARNCGVAAATGEYGLFLDSDDYWNDSTAVEQLVKRQRVFPSDVLSFAWYKYDEATKNSTLAFSAEDMPASLTTSEQQLDYLTGNGLYIASACNKLTAMPLLKAKPFESGMLSEDIEWAARLMAAADRFDYCNLAFYCYRQRADSITHSFWDKSNRDLAKAIIGCCGLLENVNPLKKPFLERYTAYQFATFIAVQALTDSDQTNVIRELTPYRHVLHSYGKNRKVRIMYYGVRLMGLKLWCRLMRRTRTIWDKRRDKI